MNSYRLTDIRYLNGRQHVIWFSWKKVSKTRRFWYITDNWFNAQGKPRSTEKLLYLKVNLGFFNSIERKRGRGWYALKKLYGGININLNVIMQNSSLNILIFWFFCPEKNDFSIIYSYFWIPISYEKVCIWASFQAYDSYKLDSYTKLV